MGVPPKRYTKQWRCFTSIPQKPSSRAVWHRRQPPRCSLKCLAWSEASALGTTKAQFGSGAGINGGQITQIFAAPLRRLISGTRGSIDLLMSRFSMWVYTWQKEVIRNARDSTPSTSGGRGNLAKVTKRSMLVTSSQLAGKGTTHIPTIDTGSPFGMPVVETDPTPCTMTWRFMSWRAESQAAATDGSYPWCVSKLVKSCRLRTLKAFIMSSAGPATGLCSITIVGQESPDSSGTEPCKSYKQDLTH